MAIVIKIICAEAGFHGPWEDQYLKAFDPYGGDQRARLLGIGALETTADIEQAKQFTDVLEAGEFWKQQSPTVPLRSDGRPNRPLTAFTVSMERYASPRQ